MPDLTADQVLEVAIPSIIDSARRQRIKDSRADISGLETDYIAEGKATGSVTARPHSGVGAATGDDLRWVYSTKLAHKSGAARWIYDSLRIDVSDGMCAYCALRDVGSLDHVLEKASHPGLAVVPANLVPACLQCNKLKEDTVNWGAVDWHPYFSSTDEQWLHATIVVGDMVHARYAVRGCDSWDEATTERARAHFGRFRLSALYSAQAANELGGRWHTFAQQAKLNRDQFVTDLSRDAESWERHEPNSWQHALYRALAESQEFVDRLREAS